jgi:hypothetical protein
MLHLFFFRMKAWWIAGILSALTMGSAAQDSPSVALPAADSKPVAATNTSSASAANLELLAELNNAVNAKKVHAGDAVKAAVTQDVILHGRIVIHRGTKLVGHVTEVKTRSKTNAESYVSVVFDRALLKGGAELALKGVIRALAAPAPPNPDDQNMPPPMLRSARQETGGPQRMDAPSVPSASRGTGLPSIDKPMDTTMPTRDNQPGVGLPHGESSQRTGNLMSGGSRGVFGLPGLQLQPGTQGGSVISSTTRNVSLASGTQILLQVNIPAPRD